MYEVETFSFGTLPKAICKLYLVNADAQSYDREMRDSAAPAAW